uniref:Uncharacterized protein n=1 Tax=Arundo donax TaxID=35708 RepID=A0A0A8ZMZ6_ARUDO
MGLNSVISTSLICKLWLRRKCVDKVNDYIRQVVSRNVLNTGIGEQVP